MQIAWVGSSGSMICNETFWRWPAATCNGKAVKYPKTCFSAGNHKSIAGIDDGQSTIDDGTVVYGRSSIVWQTPSEQTIRCT
jgi:hypothetical protein